jgi:hypothetical protein
VARTEERRVIESPIRLRETKEKKSTAHKFREAGERVIS